MSDLPISPDLTDRVVLVTGAAGGIGQALCRAFAAAGMRVGVNRSGVERLAAELGPDRAIAVEGDVTDSESCELAVEAVARGFGGLNALVNNAGLGMGIIRQDHMTKPVGIDEVSIKVWHRFMDTNLSGAFHMAKAAMPCFRAAGGGRIVNVTTSFFTMLRQGFYPYGVAKAGLEAWTASLAGELDGSGITVNVVVPGGPTDTPMVPPESGYDRTALIRPEQMAHPMLYLFSDAAAGITGRRFVAAHWDPSLPPGQAAFVAGAPAGWPDLARSRFGPAGDRRGSGWPGERVIGWHMSNALRGPMSLADFLEWEERQELPYEFDGLQPVAMTGGTDAHEAIGGSLRFALQTRLRGGPCRVRGPTMKIEPAGRIRYPDAFVYCSEVPPGETVIREPVVVFEVVSPSTSRADRIEKLREYQGTRSIQRYVILKQETIAATVFSRLGDDWAARPLTEGETLRMPEIGVDLPMIEIYADAPGLVPLDDTAA